MSLQQLDQYCHYLQSQLGKFSAFMVTQSKLNEEHSRIELSMSEVIRRLGKIEERMRCMEVNDRDQMLEIKRIKVEKESFRLIERRIQNLQHQLSSINKFQQQSEQNVKMSYHHRGQYSQNSFSDSVKHDNDPVNGKNQSKHSRTQHQKSKHSTSRYKSQKQLNQLTHLTQQSLEQIQQYMQRYFASQSTVQSLILKQSGQLELKIKKLQIQIDKSKESFLKLTNHVNSLQTWINSLSQSNPNFNTSKPLIERKNAENMINSNDNPPQSKMITKKELKKMERKLETFLTQKLSQITSHPLTSESERMHEKGIKFKNVHQNHQRHSSQTPVRQTKSEKIIQVENDARSLPKKKVSLFDNQMLRLKEFESDRNPNTKMSSKKKTRSSKRIDNDLSPIQLIESPRRSKQNKMPMRSNLKRLSSKRSPERMNKFNIDYMISH